MADSNPQPGLKDQLKARLGHLLASFPQQPSTARAELRNLLASQPVAVCAVIGPLLESLPESGATRQFLTALLAGFEKFPAILSDPLAMSLPAAVKLAAAVARTEPMLDTKLARWLLRGVGADPDPVAADPIRILRLLEILAALSEGGRTIPVLVQLLRHPDPRVRSKVALMAGRGLKSGTWAQQRMLESDPRLRANVVEALWGVKAPGVPDLLKAALRDPNNRVVGNALVGLYLLGDPAAATLLREMAQHPSPAFRATAAWAMGFLEDPQFLAALAALRHDPEPIVHRNVLRSLARIRKATGKSLTQADPHPPVTASQAPRSA